MTSDECESTIPSTLNSSLTIKLLSENPEKIPKVLEFLYQNEKECMYLIGNLETYGPSKGDQINSGDFFFSYSSDPNILSCVYSLCNSGVLLIYGDHQKITESNLVQIIESLLQENDKISGLIGEEEICTKFFKCFGRYLSLKNTEIAIKSDFKNILLELNDLHSRSVPVLGHQDHIRHLTPDDFSSWNSLITEFSNETKVKVNPLEAQMKIFQELIEKRHVWGYFIENDLVSTVRLNSVTLTGGSIGGVFTLPSHRKKGLARNLIEKMIKDSSECLNLQHLSLFTEESNDPALNLYKSLGFRFRGFYRMCFFEIS
jgi:ribosomal protein S18 acetylase RimI-like enzyme